MENGLLNLEQAAAFLGVSEKTMIKLLREEHIPSRKIGREWRFSREALLGWLAAGDSADYANQGGRYMVSEDVPGGRDALYDKIAGALTTLRAHGHNIRSLLGGLDRDIPVPGEATLRISYKQQRDVEKLEFKVFWSLREDMGTDAGGDPGAPARKEDA